VRILVTGATGYVGGAVTRALLAAGHDVVALVRSASAELPAGATAAVGDLTVPATYRPLVSTVDCVVHAAQRRVKGRVSARQVRLVTGTEQVAARTLGEACAAAGTRLVYTSGAFVFGDRGADWIDADAPLAPSPLGTWHAAGLRQLRPLDLDLCVLHLGMVYGPGGTFKAALYDPARLRLLRCMGSGANYWSPVHLDDVAAGFVAAVERAPAGGGEWVLADDVPLPLRELVDQVTDAMGRKRVGTVPPAVMGLVAGGPVAASLTTSYRLSNQRTKAELGWKPALPAFADGLPGTLAALGRRR
jgi:dihydroflavonol-4-reductase